MAAAPNHLHLFTHTARMLAVLKAKPDHARGPEYAVQLKDYRAEWSKLTPDERGQIALEASKIPDMGGGAIKSTIAHLEG